MPHAVTGIIVLWANAIGAIPAGWALCDGNNGTPDLDGKFVPGAGIGFSPGDTGGADDHQHPFTGDGHTHSFEVGSGPLGAGANFKEITDPAVTVGTTDSASSLPPYHALAYIMLL